MSDTESISTSSSSSSSESENVKFDQDDLLDIIAILLLPAGAEEELEITKQKDAELIDLLTQLYKVYEFDDCIFKYGLAKIVSFINLNRKSLGKHKVNLNKIDDDDLKGLIVDGLREK